MEGDFYPKYQFPGIPTEEGIDFYAPDGIISVEGYQGEIFSILRLADGTRTRDELIAEVVESGLEQDLAEAAIDDLSQLKILTDSRQLYASLHEYTKNPTRFDQNLSAQEIKEITSRPYVVDKSGIKHPLARVGTTVLSLLKERESVRSFSEQPLSINHIGELLSAAYSLENTPIPSAGGLYPLKIYALINEGHDIPSGYYQYDPTDESLIQFHEGINNRGMQFIMNSDSMLHSAPVIFIIAADMSRHSEKYANRGYRYTLLEAGHAAQNIHTTCIELELGSLEYGGFNDGLLKDELDLDSNIEPLIVLGVGKKHDKGTLETDTMTTLASLDIALVGPNKPVESVSVDIFSDAARELSFYHASAQFTKPNDSYSDNISDRITSGTATSMHLAQIKAIAEAYERYLSGAIKIDANEAATNLHSSWLDPRKVRPMDEFQLSSYPQLCHFNEKMKLQWVNGKYIKSEASILVPIDLVYYPLTEKALGRKLVSLTDSSGVAAHTEKNIAIQKGLLELIERDAVMRNWFRKESLPRIDHKILSQDVQDRVTHWRNKGFITDFIDMTPEQGEVSIINVIIRNQSESYPYFVNGAAADLDYPNAIDKALEEAELGLAYALYSQKEKAVKMQHIHSPAEHGIFYLHPENADYIKWLWEGPVTKQLKKIDKITNIIDKYNPIVVDLSSQRAPLHVVRVIELSLVPISFGYGSEYFAHPHSGVDPTKYRPTYPHYFA